MDVRAVAVLTMSIGLGGCFSAESLRKDADEKLASCLHVGMPLDAAEKCTQKAGLSFTEMPAPQGVRIYRNSAMSAGPFARAIVHLELHFSESGELESWSSKSLYDGI